MAGSGAAGWAPSTGWTARGPPASPCAFAARMKKANRGQSCHCWANSSGSSRRREVQKMRTQITRALSGLLAGAAAVALLAAPRRALADGACDWRRPDSDMRQLFPEADDYHPIYKRPFEQ